VNYRHGFHAANFADVLKHMVLVACLDYLQLKPAGLRYIDVFAGSGLYDLDSPEAQRSPEWRDGLERVRTAAAAQTAPALVVRYLEAIKTATGGRDNLYPGSPVIAASLLRPGDTARLCELHPEEAARLKSCLGRRRDMKVEARDGWQGVRALLPPPERRGVVLIDPPFEQPGEFIRLTEALKDALERFAGGTVILWHADKDPDDTARYRKHLAATGARLLAADLATAAYGSVRGLTACGVTIANPPHTLEDGLKAALPWLAEVLARAPGGGWRLERLSGRW
jgi:23S rRNA (adenine2030-N6)-methyltransferase